MSDRRPTPLGRTVLHPQPMTPDEVADLVRRARIAQADVLVDAARRGGLSRRGYAREVYRMTPCRVAAHLARFVGCSMPEAAKTFNGVSRRRVTSSGVHHAFRRMFPDAPLYTTQTKMTREQWLAQNGTK